VPKKTFKTKVGATEQTASREGWAKTAYSQRLSRRQSRHTAPELSLRRALHRSGLRFRLHRPLAKRLTVDIVLPRSSICIFVDGCWWHQCGRHKLPPKAGPNVAKWAEKFKRIKQRDQEAVELAKSLGYVPLRIWECEISENLPCVVRRISALTKSSQSVGRCLKR
jgi:DNA mismatch endonuclease, patch repair protein